MNSRKAARFSHKEIRKASVVVEKLSTMKQAEINNL